MIEWLMDSDPAIQWQVMRDLADAPDAEVRQERGRVSREGWGAALLARQQADGSWGGDNREWNSLLCLLWLRDLGADPDSEPIREATARTARNVAWKWWDNRPFFHGEVEPCINGRVLALAAYFKHDSGDLVDRLLGEQMADGGWNCEQENGSVRGSFHTTINVLEGLRAHERASAAASDEVRDALQHGEEYLLERHLLRRLSTGEVADTSFLELAFPTGYHYDILRALDYFRLAGRADDRLSEALATVEGKHSADGSWAADVDRPDQLDIGATVSAGEPNRWITLRALRVLRWAGKAA